MTHPERKLLIISGNTFPVDDWSHHTVSLWREFASVFTEVHIFARSQRQRFETASHENIYLHLIPVAQLGSSDLLFLVGLSSSTLGA